MRSERGPSLERAPKGATRRKRPSGYAGIEPSVSTQVRHRSTCQTIGMVCERGKQDPEDDRHRALKARCEHQGQDLRLVADLREADHRTRDEESFHSDAMGPGGRRTLAQPPPPDPGAGDRCQWSRQSFRSPAPWPKPSVLTQTPQRTRGRLLPNDARFLADLDF